MSKPIDPASAVVIDIGDDADPFRDADPPVLVHDTSDAEFTRAWDGHARCPVCHEGTPATRGETSFDHRRWVRFTCGDVVAVEQTAG